MPATNHFRMSAAALVVLCLAGSAEAQTTPRVRIAANMAMLEGAGRIGLNLPLVAVSGTGSFEVDDDFPTMIQADVSATVLIWRRLGIGAGLSNINDEFGHPYNGTAPWPIPGRLSVPIGGSVAQLTHDERTTYALISWTMPVSSRFDVVFSGGPAFFAIEQDIPTASAGIAPNGLPVAFVSERAFSERTTGFHTGMDLDYVWGARAGIGVMLRYSRGSIDLPEGSTMPMTVGGFSIGAGLRLKL